MYFCTPSILCFPSSFHCFVVCCFGCCIFFSFTLARASLVWCGLVFCLSFCWILSRILTFVHGFLGGSCRLLCITIILAACVIWLVVLCSAAGCCALLWFLCIFGFGCFFSRSTPCFGLWVFSIICCMLWLLAPGSDRSFHLCSCVQPDCLKQLPSNTNIIDVQTYITMSEVHADPTLAWALIRSSSTPSAPPSTERHRLLTCSFTQMRLTWQNCH